MSAAPPSRAHEIRLGFALNVSSTARTPAEVKRAYSEAIETIQYAQSLGIDKVIIGQQHFDTTAGPIASPLVFLAAVAERTSRIVLGTGVTTLPLEDPIRLAEDAATLDVISEGRLELGLAVGGANLENFTAFGLDPNERATIFAQKLRRFLDAVEGNPLIPGADGPHLFPLVPDLRERLWQGTASLDNAAAAARNRLGLHLGTYYDDPETGQVPKINAYLEAWEQTWPEIPPRVAVSRRVHFGASKDEVLERAAPLIRAQLPILVDHAVAADVHTVDGSDVRAYLDSASIYGAPEEVAEQLAADPAVRLADEVIANFNYGQDFTAAQTNRHLDLLVTEVAPRLGWTRGESPRS